MAPSPDGPSAPTASDARGAARTRRLRWRRRALLVLAGLVGGVLLAEAALQMAGVEIRAERLVRDPVLGWRNRPGWSGPVFSVNSRGFIGPEFQATKSPGTTRIVCLGDSCTAGDILPRPEDTLPRQLAARLRQRFPHARLQVINAGVGGYSSFQGRLWLEREILGYGPDALVVWFGWNDHWPARASGPDKACSGSATERLRAWLGWSKVLQLALRTYRHLRGRPAVAGEEGGATSRTDGVRRVSLDDYEANLRAMVRHMDGRGGLAVLLTAPTYLDLAARRGPVPVPESVGTRQRAEALVRVHRRYNDAVRKVARETPACLVDAAARFRDEPHPARLFWHGPDGSVDFIHLSAEGYGRVAEAVASAPAMAELLGREGP